MCRNGRTKAADALLSAPGGLGSAGMTCEHLCTCGWEGPGGGRRGRGCRCGLWASGPPLDTCRPGGGCDGLDGSGADLSRLWEPKLFSGTLAW